jgi:hypothetical protein
MLKTGFVTSFIIIPDPLHHPRFGVFASNMSGDLTKSVINRGNDTGFLDKSNALFPMVRSANSDFAWLARKFGFSVQNHPAHAEIDL